MLQQLETKESKILVPRLLLGFSVWAAASRYFMSNAFVQIHGQPQQCRYRMPFRENHRTQQKIATALSDQRNPASGTTRSTTSSVSKSSQEIIYEVCMSPACMADGSQATLERLRAVTTCGVAEGSCHSLCGKGPIVKIASSKKNYVTKDKVLELLFPEEDTPMDILQIVEAIEYAQAGHEAFKAKDYEHATQLYQQAIDIGFHPSRKLHIQQLESHYSVGLEWLLETRRQQALALLKMKRTQDALLAAQAACNLSNNQDIDSFRILVDVYQQKNDIKGEYEAIKRVLSFDVNKSISHLVTSNDRRLLQFRLNKLQKLLEQEA